MTTSDDFKILKQIISREAGIVKILENAIEKGKNQSEWIVELKEANNLLLQSLNRINLPQKQTSSYSEKKSEKIPEKKAEERMLILPSKTEKVSEFRPYELTKAEERLEREVIKRLKKKEKVAEKTKIRKPNPYVKQASSVFSEVSLELYKRKIFKTLKKDLIKANLPFLPVSYISTILYTTMWSILISLILFIFFLFFNLNFTLPIIELSSTPILSRLIKVIWIILVIPIATSIFMYSYPSMERKSLENRINQELPFVMINMSAISGSMIEPSKIFEIIVSTGEFPNISREFRKIINEVNVHGYDLVSALREIASNTSSRKLAELLNGLATSITSGGDLPLFFEEKAKTFLFDYRLERERNTRAAETFMDIYISVVIAAPMMLMLLLMMIKFGGLGFCGLTTNALTLIMILGVVGINIIFLTFLYLKQPTTS